MGDDIPPAVRREVIERDSSCCRACGQYVPTPALHHIVFRSHGGLHVPENLVVIGWLPGHDCHLQLAHGPEAGVFRPLLQACTAMPGVTALALRRWSQST